MGERKKIALIFSYNENWIGGTYYIFNLIHSFKLLPDKDQPFVTICSEKESDFERVTRETSYPHLAFFNTLQKKTKLSLFKRAINYFLYVVTKRVLFQKPPPVRLPDQFDIVFPNPSEEVFKDIPVEKKIFWTPDFQEDYLPDYFSDDEIFNRKLNQLYNAVKARNVIFSSTSALDDFKRLYPFAKCKSSVLHFAVTHPNYEDMDLNKVLSKYRLENNYFMSPNQFWAHKNHMTVIKAVQSLKQQGINITLVFSGKEYDYRQPDYTQTLKDYVTNNGLDDQIRFIGFIDRKEQLLLMKNAIAIIQPSFFEGWSTVVEDAKAMNQLVIASDIKVHREQLPVNGIFFNATDVQALAGILATIAAKPIDKKFFDYARHVETFATTFSSLL